MLKKGSAWGPVTLPVFKTGERQVSCLWSVRLRHASAICYHPSFCQSTQSPFISGSITRYRPHQYDAIASGQFGPWIQEFVNGQPLQFVYLLASEFAQTMRVLRH